ncbi:MAG: phage protein Gp36 family protein [Candidatus Dormibacteria bacterium]
MAYADPQDLINRYSSQTLGDLVADDGNAVSEAGLLTDPKIMASLSDGAARINAAILQAGRYKLSDLATLMGDDASLLIRMNCDLAWSNLLRRKTTSKIEDVKAAKEDAEFWLEELREGKDVFNLASAITAGNPSVSSPTIHQYSEQNLIVDRCRSRFGAYPARRIQNTFA